MTIETGSKYNLANSIGQGNFDAIPLELKERKQWCLWRLEYDPSTMPKPTKPLYIAEAGHGKASVTKAETWRSFNEAILAPLTCIEPCHPDTPISETGYSGIGYVFAQDDPYSGIDLDDVHGDAEAAERATRICKEFDSYTELSPSGTGVHIIVKGRVPSGRRRAGVELYSQARYFTMTGNVINNVGIAERQDLLDILHQQLGGDVVECDASQFYKPANETDEAVFNRASGAANRDKFLSYWNGDATYLVSDKSGSSIDMALVDMLVFYTKDPAQVERLWLSSRHGQRAKTQNTVEYRRRTINKAFDRCQPQLPAIATGYTIKGQTFPQTAPRRGIRASDLQHKQFADVNWVVPGFITQGLTILGGRPKLGKSWLCLSTALAVAEGGYVLGSWCQPGDVAYYALEDTERRLQSRTYKTRGKEPWPINLELFVELARGPEGIQEVRTWLQASPNAKLVIIDTLAKVRPAGKGDNRYDADYQAVADWKSLADEFEVAIVLVHHTRKMLADDPLEMISGTNGITGAADSIIILERNSQGCSLLGRGRDLEEFAIAIKLDENCVWQKLGDVDEVQRSDERNSIINLLANNNEKISPKDIAHSLSMDGNNVRQLLSKMVNKGELLKSGRGLYSRPDHITPHNTGNNDNKGLL